LQVSLILLLVLGCCSWRIVQGRELPRLGSRGWRGRRRLLRRGSMRQSCRTVLESLGGVRCLPSLGAGRQELGRIMEGWRRARFGAGNCRLWGACPAPKKIGQTTNKPWREGVF